MPAISKIKTSKAFTLIELLVVVGIITILFAIVLIAINPGRQLAQADDTKRRSDINAILNAVHQYAADNKGQLPADIPSGTPEVIGDTTPASQADICDDIVTLYIAEMPVDPDDGTWGGSCAAGYDTNDYSIVINGGRVTVSTPAEVSGVGTLSITR